MGAGNTSNTECQTLLQNPEMMSEVHKRIFVAVNSFISLTTIVFNATVIMSIFTLKTFRRPSHFLLTVLACSDATVGLLSNTSLSYSVLRDQTDCVFVALLSSCSYVPMIVSGCFTVLVTAERLIHMRSLDMHSQCITQTRTVISVFISGIFGIVVGVLVVMASIYNVLPTVIKATIALDSSLLLILTFLFVKTYRGLRRQINNLISQLENQPEVESQAEASMQYNLNKSVLYILVSLWIGLGPYVITTVSSSAFKDWKHLSITFLWTLMGIELNSTINALVVILINKDIRKHITNLMDRF